MLLLVTIGLVLVGAVSLVIGFVSNTLAWIYLSIGCSVIAGVVLVVFSRMARSGEGGGAPSAYSHPTPGAWSPPPTPPPSYARSEPPTSVTTAPPPPLPPLGGDEPAPRRGAAAQDRTAGAAAGSAFPIAGYDRLRVSQIIPLLDRLDVDELEQVRAHEEANKNRPTLLRELDGLVGEVEGDEAAPAADDDVVDVDDLDEVTPLDDEDEIVAAPPGEASAGGFPIDDYDRRSVEEILARLDDLDNDELDMVAEREELGQNRAVILDAIDAMFDDIDDDQPPSPPPPPLRPRAKATAPRAAAGARPAAPTPARKAAAKAAPVPRKAAAATAAPAAKKAATGRTAAPAAKAATAARKAAATRPAPTAKAATAAREAAATRPAPTAKAAAKKAAPVSRAAKKR